MNLIGTDEERWAAWCQWKERCAWKKCDGAEREMLATFAYARLKGAFYEHPAKSGTSKIEFSNYFPQIDYKSDGNLVAAFGYVENHFLSKNTIENKRPKDWIFEHGSRSCVEGRLTQAINTELIRKLLGDSRRKIHEKTQLFRPCTEINEAMEAGVPEEVIERLLRQGKATVKDESEYRYRAQEVAKIVFLDLPRVVRVAFLAKRFKVSTADPKVTAAAGVEKSAISSAWTNFRKRMQAAVDEEGFEHDEMSEQNLYVRLLYRELESRIKMWSEAEKIEWADFNKEDNK